MILTQKSVSYNIAVKCSRFVNRTFPCNDVVSKIKRQDIQRFGITADAHRSLRAIERDASIEGRELSIFFDGYAIVDGLFKHIRVLKWKTMKRFCFGNGYHFPLFFVEP